MENIQNKNVEPFWEKSSERVDALRGFATPLPTTVLNISTKSRSNLFPWRGQFSPQFVESLLRAYAVPGSTVLDPFMGSGTVLIESARLGFGACGCEVNPAAYLLARVYELCHFTQKQRRDLLETTESLLVQMQPSLFDLPLFRQGNTHGFGAKNGFDLLHHATDSQTKILLEALILLLDGDAISDQSFLQKWSMLRSIVTGLPHSENPVCCYLRDARCVPLPDDTIDFVLSSPPYINVFNYHHNLRGGIESLGWRPLVVARSEIGSNRKFRQNRFLTVVQYCMDLALALAELCRVCTPTARIILVLGRESNVHKTPFYNGNILKRLATEVMGMELHLEQERGFLNRFGQRIYEDILHLVPGRGFDVPHKIAMERARMLAKEILTSAIQRVPDERKHYLQQAVNECDTVTPSPIFDPNSSRGDTP